MTYNLTVGKQRESDFLSLTKNIVKDVGLGHTLEATKKIHSDLFHGKSSAPKAFRDLFSLSGPSSKATIERTLIAIPVKGKELSNAEKESSIFKKTEGNYYGDEQRYYTLVKTEKKVSFSAVLGILEGIPIIGSVIGAIQLLGHYSLALASHVRLKQASIAYINAAPDTKVEKAQKVYAAMVDLATHHYYLGGSALAIIPGLKPLVRLVQGILHNCKTPEKPQQPAPISKEAIEREVPVKDLGKPTVANIIQHRKNTVKYSKSDLPVPPPRPPSVPKPSNLVEERARLQKRRIKDNRAHMQQRREKVLAFKPQLPEQIKTERS